MWPIRMTLARLRFSFVLLLLGSLLASLPVSARHARHKRVVVRAAMFTEPRTAEQSTVMRGRASWYGKYFQGRRTTSGERYNRFAYTCAHKTLPFGTRLRVTSLGNGKSVVVRVTDRGPFRNRRIIDLSEIAGGLLDAIDKGSIPIIAEVVPATTPLGPTDAPENLLALQAADPAPRAPFTTYREPAVDLTTKTLTVETLTDGVIATAAAPTQALPAPAPAGPAAPAEAAAEVPVATSVLTYIVQAGTFGNLENARALLARILALDERLLVALQAETINGKLLNRVMVGNFTDRAQAVALQARLRVWGIGGLVRGVSAGPAAEVAAAQ